MPVDLNALERMNPDSYQYLVALAEAYPEMAKELRALRKENQRMATNEFWDNNPEQMGR